MDRNTPGCLYSFDGITWTTYTTEDGLVKNYVENIAIDADNVKWIATNGGGCIEI